ncbi:MAG: peptidylprolyl isomerase, partial [Bacteroidota bacterium]|nr:peptidylprolyl isomerase [Bacteroidota bacterium]
MKKTLIILATLVLSVFVTKAQKDNDIVLEIGGEKISKTEFLKMYNRNNVSNSGTIDKEDLNAYLDLYINYRLKLLQAREEGLDSIKSFVDEVDSYRKQMIQPYINNSDITDSLVNEAYQREKEFIRASHILINLPANATPKDTLEAYNKALMIRNKALKGENFDSLAVIYSEDPSAKGSQATEDKPAMIGNKGDLGYFTSMTMVYPFESACYSLQKGEISMPIKTNFGYHIIKLTDRIPAPFFTCNIKHVWINAQNHTPEEAKRLIEEAYSHVEEWKIDSVARKYSEDTYSAQNNGWLMNQKPNTLPAEYVALIKDMKEEDISPIIQTRFGWHFFKLMNITPLKPLNERRGAILQRISKDARGYKSIENFVAQSKDYYNFKENKKIFDEIKPLVSDSVFEGTWKMPEDYIGDKIVFTIGDTSFTQKDFLQELYTYQHKQTPEYVPLFLDKFYTNIVNKKVLEYADSKLEDRYPELKEVMQEFRDGLL